MFNAPAFIQVTTHQDQTAALIPVSKIATVFPVTLTEQLAHGKTVILLETGIRITCSESFEEVKKLLMPERH